MVRSVSRRLPLKVAADQIDFDSVRIAYERGDSRPLSQWVLNHDLTSDQREYVARALCGDIEKIDGRKVKPTTERLISDYTNFQWINHTIASFNLDELGMEFMKDADIARKLASEYGYQDVDSVRRALSRHKRKMKLTAPKKKRVLAE